MGRFLARLACFAAIQLVPILLVLHYGAPQRANDFLSAIHDKQDRLLASEGRRLIFVGGSNLAFGISSELFAEQFDGEIINCGLHAGLGLDLPLDMIEQNVRPGDLIIVSPEYSLMATEAYLGESATIERLLTLFPEARQHVDADVATQNQEHDFGLAHEWFCRARRRLLRRTSVYARSNFNEYGDMVGHHRVTAQVRDYPVLPEADPAWSNRAIERLNQFHRHCRDRGSQVFFCYAPLPENTYQHAKAAIEELHQRLEQDLVMDVIHAPHEVTYPDSYFFDTVYHLTQAGAAARSRFLISCLDTNSRR